MKLNQPTIQCIARTLAGAAIACGLAGCGDFFTEKQTEIESVAILQELTQVRESPEAANPLPEIYRQPTERLEIKGGIKLFYFTRHHPAGELARLLQQQMGVQSTVNLATNQIVAYCKDTPQADAVQQYLELVDVMPVQVNVDCLILERFGNITMDWETTLLVENLLGEGITLGEGKFPEPAFPGASLREAERGNFGLDFGYWIDQGVEGHQVRTVVDVLVSRGYLKILLNPQLETVNGKKASVTIRDYAPIEEVKTGQGGSSNVYNITKYVWVENTLEVTPHVYADGSIGLATKINIGSRSKPEGVVQRAIITERSIDVEENRIDPGKSLIIGGMRKSEKRSVVRGIPFFQDLPLIGILFSSKDFEEKGTEIIFILTPTVSSGGVENAAMVADIRNKYEEPEYEKNLIGPLGKDPFTQVLEREATEAELRRIQAELDFQQAQLQADAERERAEKVSTKTQRLRQDAHAARLKARQAVEAAQKATAEAEAVKQQAEATAEQIAEMEQKKAQALQAAEAARRQAQEAADKAHQAAEQAQQVRRQSEQSRSRLEKARQDAAEQAAPAPQEDPTSTEPPETPAQPEGSEVPPAPDPAP